VIVVVLMAAAVVALTTGGTVGADPPESVERRLADMDGARPRAVPGDPSVGPATAPADLAPPVGPPTMARLLEIADEVSQDGRYVRIGDVEISASPVVTRGS
jgi:hypothetical protein